MNDFETGHLLRRFHELSYYDKIYEISSMVGTDPDGNAFEVDTLTLNVVSYPDETGRTLKPRRGIHRCAKEIIRTILNRDYNWFCVHSITSHIAVDGNTFEPIIIYKLKYALT